jgi:hypothetical protein
VAAHQVEGAQQVVIAAAVLVVVVALMLNICSKPAILQIL